MRESMTAGRTGEHSRGAIRRVALTALAVFGVVLGCVYLTLAVTNDNTSLRIRRIQSWFTGGGDAAYVIANNQQQWEDAWRHYLGGQQAPPVDFNQEFAVLAFYDTQVNSCHEFSIKSAYLNGRELTVSTDFRDLYGKYACASWLMQPFDVVAISKSGIKQGRYNVSIVELGGPKEFGLGRQVLYEREMDLP